MEVGCSPINSSASQDDRWNHLQTVLTRTSPLAHPEFEPNEETLSFIQDTCKLLVVGAGGLGCELMKDLVLMGFKNIDVIDMDTIDLSNLNRQFLFRPKDIGRPKADVAAEFVNNRVPGVRIKPHCCPIQDYDADFYRQFHIIVCGLDSVVARRWMNGMLVSLLTYTDDGQLDVSSVIPLIDGGTEGFKGNARVILPGVSACIDCTLDLYPPQVNYPLCTIAHTPRLPEHCVEYAKVLLWPKENPFGEGVSIDGDNPDHVSWLLEQAEQRATQHNITGVTYRLTQGVVKRIIPAVASSNAVIAAACTSEVFKMATSCSPPLSNYMVFNDTDGVYTYSFEAEKREDCPTCSIKPVTMTFHEDATLQDLYDHLIQTFQMKSPSLTTVVNGNNKTLYMPNVPSIEQVTKKNLKEKLTVLGIQDNHEIVVADPTSPKQVIIIIRLTFDMS
ncbi:NEDD8-activating enzyme E1 catalytic subunit-like [Dysidea avara]|uniref:NEDD8-activating enzyme E1 catalytic subunit-like n=1 Tax=Dysidea avara TaxID=196820 RepID=UPI003320254F